MVQYVIQTCSSTKRHLYSYLVYEAAHLFLTNRIPDSCGFVLHDLKDFIQFFSGIRPDTSTDLLGFIYISGKAVTLSLLYLKLPHCDFDKVKSYENRPLCFIQEVISGAMKAALAIVLVLEILIYYKNV